MAWIQVGRPHFLVAGFLYYGLGALTVQDPTAMDWRAYWTGQVFVTLTQWMVHYQNDLHDRHGDAANDQRTLFSGSSGVLADGRLPLAAVRWTGRILSGLAVAAAMWLLITLRPGPIAVALVVAVFLFSAAYSVPPWRLQERGWGPLVIIAVVPLGLPLLGASLQNGDLLPVLRDASPLALLLLGAVLLLDIPDEAADRAVGKRTPVVRWGATRVRYLAAAALGAAYLNALLVHPFGHSDAATLAALISLPFGVLLMATLVRNNTAPQRRVGLLQGGAILLAGGTAAVQAVLLFTPLL